MTRRLLLLPAAAIVLMAASTASCLAQDFKIYPGATLDEKASRDASGAAPDKESKVYTTTDSLDKVSAFYKGLYKEVTMRSAPKLPSGEQIRWFFFSIDGEPSMAKSKFWMKIQRPYIGGADNKDIRDVTLIQTVRSK